MAWRGAAGGVDVGVGVARSYSGVWDQLLSAGSKKLRPFARSPRSSVPVSPQLMTSYFAAVPSIRCTRLPHCSRVVVFHGRPWLIMAVHYFSRLSFRPRVGQGHRKTKILVGPRCSGSPALKRPTGQTASRIVDFARRRCTAH